MSGGKVVMGKGDFSGVSGYGEQGCLSVPGVYVWVRISAWSDDINCRAVFNNPEVKTESAYPSAAVTHSILRCLIQEFWRSKTLAA